MKATTLREARKLGLSPSVSGITKMMPASGLDKWKIDQAVMSALTLKRGRGEDDRAFMKRLAVDAKQTASRAADHGTAIHANIERYLLGKVPKDIINGFPVYQATQRFIDYWESEGYDLVYSEKTFCHSMGYGGTVDIIATKEKGAEQYILDMKTKDTVEGKEIVPYKENGMQLVAYKRGLRLRPRTVLKNLFISRNDPEFPVQEHTWDDEEPLLIMFDACLTFWKALKGYDPAKGMK